MPDWSPFGYLLYNAIGEEPSSVTHKLYRDITGSIGNDKTSFKMCEVCKSKDTRSSRYIFCFHGYLCKRTENMMLQCLKNYGIQSTDKWQFIRSIQQVWDAYLWNGSSYQTLYKVCVSFCTHCRPVKYLNTAFYSGSVVVDLLFYVSPIVCRGSVLVFDFGMLYVM